MKRRPQSNVFHAPVRCAGALLFIFALLGFRPVYGTDAAGATNSVRVTDTSTPLEPTEALPVPQGLEGGRLAQGLFRRGEYAAAARAYIEAAEGIEPGLASRFRFNAAVAFYHAGEFRMAADLFEDLMTTATDRTGSARGLGAALYHAEPQSAETQPDTLQAKATLLQRSGEAFKDALRAQADDERIRHNLAVVLRDLAKAQEEARLAQLLERYKDVPPVQLADTMLREQRAIAHDGKAAFANPSPAQIRLLEDVAKRQKVNAQLWIPLKQKLMQMVATQPQTTNAVSASNLEQFIEATRDRMLDAADSLLDLDRRGLESAEVAERYVYRIWKGVASYAQLIEEDLRRQTNAVYATRQTLSGDATDSAPVEDQAECLSLTHLFAKRFEEAFSGSQQPPVQENTATNATPGQPALTPEDREKIEALTQRAIDEQSQAMTLLGNRDLAPALPHQEESVTLLEQIRDLLPKDPNQNQSSPQQDKDEQQQDSQQEEPQPREDQKDQGQEDQQQPQPQPQPDSPAQPEETEEPEPREESPPEEQSRGPSEDEIEQVLQKILEREQEYKDEKRRQQEHVPLPPSARDW